MKMVACKNTIFLKILSAKKIESGLHIELTTALVIAMKRLNTDNCKVVQLQELL